MKQPTYIKLPGNVTPHGAQPHRVVCIVRYSDANRYDSLVADSFRDYYQLDVERERRERPEHFKAPHNIAFAILNYRYFRPRWGRFSLSSWEFIRTDQLPTRNPNASDEDFALWVESTPEIESLPAS